MNRYIAEATAFATALIAAAVTVTPPARAQAVTDGTLGRAGALAGPNFAVTADLGRQVGANLFHSFSQFGLAQGQSATFSGPAGIANIITRVTGGAPSVIDGLLRSTITGADFYLFNPAGVAFGPNASIDVGGAFHASSAHSVRLADGGRFDAADPAASSLTAAPPAAFGFLGGQGAVVVDGAVLGLPHGAALGLVGGDVGVGNGAALFTYSAPLGIASVSGPGEVALGRDGIAGVAGSRGTIVLADATLRSASEGGRPAGAIRIVGGDILVAEGSDVTASNLSAAAGGGIMLDAAGLLLLSDGRLYTDTFSEAGASGDIRVTAPTILVQDASSITTSSLGPGNAGNVEIAAQDVTVSGSSRLSATSWGDGDAGAIRVNAARSVTLQAAGNLTSSSHGAGAAGDIEVRTDRLTAEGGYIAATVWDVGRSGTITLDVGELVLREAFVSASGSTIGRGDGGNISVRASRGVTIEGFLAGLSTTTNDGRGGNIFVATPGLVVTDAGSITSATFGAGPAGNVAIEVVDLRLGEMGTISASSSTDATGPGGNISIVATGGVTVSSGMFGGIESNTLGRGPGGDVTIVAPRVDLVDGGISVSTQGSGRAGSITLRAGERVLIDAGLLQGGLQASSRGTGDGGDIVIQAPQVVVRGAGGISAYTSGPGRGGSIAIEAGEATLDAGAQVRSFTLGSGRGGSVDIHAREIGISGGSLILAFSGGDGAGGNVILRADRSIRIAGEGPGPATTGIYAAAEDSGPGGNVRLSAPAIEVTDSGFVFAGTRGGGPGGSVTFEGGDIVFSRLGFADVSTEGSGAAGRLTVRASGSVTVTGTDGATVSTGLSGGSSGTGAGGSVTIQAPRIVIDDGATVNSVARAGGRGGSIELEAGDLEVRGAGAINASSTGPGAAGDVTVRASGSVVVEGGGYGFVSGIAAQSQASGPGGRLDIAAPRVEVRDGALVTARAFSTGAAGSIRIAAGDALVVAGGGSIATRTTQSDGGNIAIEGRGVVHVTGGSITTSVQGGAGDGGNIAIVGPAHVVLNHGQVQANAYGGDGGNITIDSAHFIASPGSVVEASSQLGVSGSITVTAPVVDIGAGLGALPAGFFDASRLLREACASRAGESENSFVVAGRGAMPESAWSAYASARARRAATPCGGASK